MSAKTNTGQGSQNQQISQTARKADVPDHRKASDLEARIIGELTYAVRFAGLSNDHAEMFDYQGFVLSLEKFLDHARVVSALLKDLRKVRGVID